MSHIHGKSALLVVTSHTEMGDSGQKTGFWFEELAVPFWGFYDAGFQVTIASIKGGAAQADPMSLTEPFRSASVERFLNSEFAMDLLDQSLCIDQVNSDDYTTLFLCGGHGTLWDFRQSRGLARVVSRFYAREKLIGAVCHGPTGLLSAKKPNGEDLVKDLRLTAFTDAEEELTPPIYQEELPYHLEDALRQEGADFIADKPGAAHVVWEKGLITGQNPQSSALVTQTILDTLEKTRVWIDTDISIGAHTPSGGLCDVDDAYAMAYLFNAPSVHVEGISTVFGNTDVDTATHLARSMANRFGPISLPVMKGAAQALDMEKIEETPAVKAMAAKLEQTSMTIVAIGPATNVAALVLLYPHLAERIDNVILVAGRSSTDVHFLAGPRQTVPFRDLNFDLDPDAMRILLETQVPVTLAPFELSHQVWITEKELATLGSHDGVGTFLKNKSMPWLEFWAKDFGARGFNPFDALAAGIAVNPNQFIGRELPVKIQIAPDDTRTPRFGEPTAYKPYLIASPDCVSARTVKFCTGISVDFAQELLDTIVCPNNPASFVSAVSHINVVVDDVDQAAAFYKRTLGFEQAIDADGVPMDYPHITLASFAKDAGFLDGKVDVDIRFLHHPTAGLYLELMRYYEPKGRDHFKNRNVNDMGGIRHVAMEVTDVFEAFEYLKDQPGVELVHYPASDPQEKDDDVGPPMMLTPFPVSFFYWRDPYGVIWEMECGRKRGHLRGI